MKKLHFFRLLFGAMFAVAATAFVGCSDNDGNDDIQIPTLDVAPKSLVFDENGGTQTFDISTDGYWKITGTEGQDWLAVSPKLEGTGSQTITVTVGQDKDNAHSAELKVTVYATILGIQKEVTSETVKVTQTPSGVIPSDEVIYENNFDKAAAEKVGTQWPFLDQTDVWQNAEGTGISTVTYSSEHVSVRRSGKLSGGYDGASGGNKIFFGTLPADFAIENITLPEGAKNFRLVFGGSYSKQGDNNQYDNIFKPESFKVTLGNGTEWSGAVTYEKIGGDDTKDPFWLYFAADFTLNEAVSKLSVKFTADIASGFAIDDVKLAEGLGGQTITFDGTTPPEPGVDQPITIVELNAACVAAGDSQAVVDATNNRVFEAIVMNDVAAENYSYNNLILATEGATQPGSGITLYGSQVEPSTLNLTMGDKVKVTLYAGEAKATVYRKMHEITGGKDATWAKVEKIGSGVTIAPVEIASNQIADYQAMPVVIKNATLTGSGVWCTEAAAGQQKLTAAAGEFSLYIKANAAAFVNQTYEGATGDIYGIAVCAQDNVQLTPRNLNDVKAFMSSTPLITGTDPASLMFTAAGETKTLTVSTANADGATIEATSDNTHFSPSVNGLTVSVVAGENTSAAAITGVLTLKLMLNGSVVDTKTVNMTQSAPVSGDVMVVEANFTELSDYPAGFPTSKIEGPETYTFGGYSYTFAGTANNGYYEAFVDKEKTQPYLIIGKAGAYIEFPAVEGKTLTTVTLTTRAGSSKNVAVGIYNDANQPVSGGEAILWSQDGGQVEYTYNLTGTAAGTKYRAYIAKNPSTGKEYNAQFVHIKLEYN